MKKEELSPPQQRLALKRQHQAEHDREILLFWKTRQVGGTALERWLRPAPTKVVKTTVDEPQRSKFDNVGAVKVE